MCRVKNYFIEFETYHVQCGSRRPREHSLCTDSFLKGVEDRILCMLHFSPIRSKSLPHFSVGGFYLTEGFVDADVPFLKFFLYFLYSKMNLHIVLLKYSLI
jgi:hypothetical protein